jgi:hypothetical protein
MCLAAGMGPDGIVGIVWKKVQLPWRHKPTPIGDLVFQGWTVFIAAMGFSCLSATVHHVLNEHEVGQLPYALSDLLPVVILGALLTSWEPTVFERVPRLLCFTTGLLYFFYTAQMIVYSMARMAFPVVQGTLVPYAALVALSWFAKGKGQFRHQLR